MDLGRRAYDDREPGPAPEGPGRLGTRRLKSRRVRAAALTGLFVLASLYTLSLARAFLIPLAVGVLAFFLLRPPVRLLRRLGIGEAWGAAIVLMGLCTLAGLSLYALSWPAAAWLGRAPETVRTVERRLAPLAARLLALTRTADEMERLATVSPVEGATEVRVQPPGIREMFMGGIQTLIGNTVIVLTLVYFLLAEGDAFIRKVIFLLPRLKERQRAVEIAREMEVQISQYLLWTTLLNAGLGVVTGLAMWALGMPNPALWGFVAFVTNFVPYLGGFVCTVLIALASVATFPDLWRALLAPGVFMVINTMESYFVNPAVMGRRFALNTPVLFVGLLFWWYVWGMAGALLAVPMMAAFRIFCERVEGLQSMAAFLAEPPRKTFEGTDPTSPVEAKE